MSQTSQNNQQSSIATQASSSAAAGTTNTNTIPVTAPPGTLSFTAPQQTATPSFYKIMANNPITFGWNYTSLISTPAALTIQAYCSLNQNTYQVATIPGSATEVTWDAFAQQTAANGLQLAQATYTLRIFDERGLTAGAEAGKLMPNQNVKFAMYKPADYTPIASGWKCVSCSDGTPTFSTPSFLALGMTLVVMMISSLGLLRSVVRN